MAHHDPEATAIERVLEVLSAHGLDAMAEAMQTLMNEAMKLERSEFLRAGPGERTRERIGHANGFKDKSARSRVGELELRIPQVRPLPGGDPLAFYPQALERGLRSERALKLAIAEMYVQGVSTGRVTEVTRERCGMEVTSAQVSRAAAELDAQLSAWRGRPLSRCAYLLLDARYEEVRHGGAIVDCAVLVAMGVREGDGKHPRWASVSVSEAEVHWRAFLESLKQRRAGGDGVRHERRPLGAAGGAPPGEPDPRRATTSTGGAGGHPNWGRQRNVASCAARSKYAAARVSVTQGEV